MTTRRLSCKSATLFLLAAVVQLAAGALPPAAAQSRFAIMCSRAASLTAWTPDAPHAPHHHEPACCLCVVELFGAPAPASALAAPVRTIGESVAAGDGAPAGARRAKARAPPG